MILGSYYIANLPLLQGGGGGPPKVDLCLAGFVQQRHFPDAWPSTVLPCFAIEKASSKSGSIIRGCGVLE